MEELRNNLKSKDLPSTKVVVSSHTTFNWGPEEMLTLYLQNCDELLSIRHPFGDKIGNPSFFELYQSGKKLIRKEISSNHNELISYLKDLIVTIRLIIKQDKRYDLFIGIDPLNGFAGLILKHLGKIQKVIFYPIDYSPKRFDNLILNSIYHMMEIHCAKHADSVWFLAEGILDKFISKGIDKKKCVYTPIQIEKIYQNESDYLDNPVIAYMGALYPYKGIELIIDSLPVVLKSIPHVKLVIIGGGPLENSLRQRVKDLQLENHVTFTGHIASRTTAMDMLSKCTIGIAPYLVNKNLYTSFAFGAKVYDYMACGMPVIITHWKEIEKNGLGLTVECDIESLSKAVIRMLTDKELYEKCKKNVQEMAKAHYYKTVFDNAFSSMV